MEKLYKYLEFLNEKKTDDKTKKEIEKDAKKVATEMFDKTGKIEFGYKNGLPSTITFDVTESDYDLSYNSILSMEYSENVLKKRAYKVELKYKSKSENKGKYSMTFGVKLTATNNVDSTPKDDYYLVWEFEEKPKSVVSMMKGCKWDDPVIRIKKSIWDKLELKDEIKRAISKAEGIKKRNEKI